jgi:hypothetical protein
MIHEIPEGGQFITYTKFEDGTLAIEEPRLYKSEMRDVIFPDFVANAWKRIRFIDVLKSCPRLDNLPNWFWELKIDPVLKQFICNVIAARIEEGVDMESIFHGQHWEPIHELESVAQKAERLFNKQVITIHSLERMYDANIPIPFNVTRIAYKPKEGGDLRYLYFLRMPGEACDVMSVMGITETIPTRFTFVRR